MKWIKTVSNYFNFINSCKVNYFYHENSNFYYFQIQKHIELMSDDSLINLKKFKLLAKYISLFTGGMEDIGNIFINTVNPQ